MSNAPVVPEPELPKGLWGLFLLMGGLLIVLGILAAIVPFVAAYVAIKLCGGLLLVSGVVHAIAVFQARSWNGTFLHLFKAILAVAVGFFFLKDTDDAGGALMLLLAMYLVVGGLFRIFGSLLVRTPHWLMNVLGGVVSLVLGLMVSQNWPHEWWVIGVFIAIDLMFQGFSALSLALLLLFRRSP